jgi:hypothetical protein
MKTSIGSHSAMGRFSRKPLTIGALRQSIQAFGSILLRTTIESNADLRTPCIKVGRSFVKDAASMHTIHRVRC